jgi:hypothetical protein
MEINKEYLERKLKEVISQLNKLNEQINIGLANSHRLEGAIDTIKLLLEEQNKSESNDVNSTTSS